MTNRLDDFVVGLTNDNPVRSSPIFKQSYAICAQYSGSVTAGDNATVICAPSSQKFRYIIVHASHGSPVLYGSLCLAEVAVYGRSK